MKDDRSSAAADLQAQIAELQARIRVLETLVLHTNRRSWREKFRPKIWNFKQYDPRELDVPLGYERERLPADPPQIAMVTPSYNHARFLKATIDSVLGQNYPKLQYIVQDAASTDGTRDILQAYGSRIAWRSEKDAGQADGINRGFDVVTGDIMAYLNSDDLLLPGTLAYVAATFRKHPDVDFIYGNRIIIDRNGWETGRVVLPRHDAEALKWADYIPQETMFWRRSVWEKIGPFDASFNYAMDWDFILRAQAAGFRFRRMPRFMGCFRVYPEHKTSALESVGQQEQMRIRERHLGLMPTQEKINKTIITYLRRHVLYHRLYKLKLYMRNITRN